MKKSEKTFSHKNLSYSPEKSGKKISNSNSSSLLQIKQINFVKEEDNSKNKDKQIFNSFYSLNEEVKNNANTQRDINSELYERLRNGRIERLIKESVHNRFGFDDIIKNNIQKNNEKEEKVFESNEEEENSEDENNENEENENDNFNNNNNLNNNTAEFKSKNKNKNKKISKNQKYGSNEDEKEEEKKDLIPL